MNIFMMMFIVFLTLKLLKVIAWSWWLVTAPLWAGLVMAVTVVVALALAEVLREDKRKKRGY